MKLKWIGPLGLLAALVVGDQIRINRPGHKYRMTVEVETPTGVKSASGVATLVGHLDRVFAEAFPKLAKAERSRMLAAWSDITGAMIAGLDRSKPSERGKLLEELKTILSAYLEAKLAASG
jgi:hypothetical protein